MARPDRITDLRKVVKKEEVDKWEAGIHGLRKESLTWDAAGAEDLLAALVAVTEDGAALLLSKTSDGGALAIQVLTGSGRHKLYPSSVAELHEALDLLAHISE